MMHYEMLFAQDGALTKVIRVGTVETSSKSVSIVKKNNGTTVCLVVSEDLREAIRDARSELDIPAPESASVTLQALDSLLHECAGNESVRINTDFLVEIRNLIPTPLGYEAIIVG